MALLQRLQRFLAEPAPDPAMTALYKASVAQARLPAFYAALGVPDTIDGRFDLLVLHVFLVMRRLGGAEQKQQLFDLLFTDMDHSLREMGVGDMGMGKRMKAMIAAFYGRAQAYEKALAADGDADLMEALARNIYGNAAPPPTVCARMAAYTRALIAALGRQPLERLASGHVEFALPPA